MAKTETGLQRRKRRVRYSLKQRAGGRARLSVIRSNKQIYAQIIDDTKGITLVSASTLDKDVKAKIKGASSNIEAATLVGIEIAARAKKAKVAEVVFDRGGVIYHGRVKALADAAREAGLKF
jgi:large subunit ribosomal protein L18